MILSFISWGIKYQQFLPYVFLSVFFFLGLIGVFLFKVIVIKKLKKWADGTPNPIDNFFVNAIESTLIPLAYFGLFYMVLSSLASIPVVLTKFPIIKKIIKDFGVIVLTISVIRMIAGLVSYAMEIYWLKGEKNTTKEVAFNGIIMLVRGIVWALGIIFLLDNFGFNISSILTGLGIGGVAIALAAQAVLGDLFSYLAIFFDRPFEVGDFIVSGEIRGTVEHIGIKTTRIRSISGEQLILSNSQLTNSKISNYRRMEERRVQFHLGVTYQTSTEKLSQIPETITRIIQQFPETRFDRAHFSSFGDSSLVIEVVYFVLSNDYNKYMDIHQQVNLAIKKSFEGDAIDFAYPTQTVFVRGYDPSILTNEARPLTA